jgi:glyoxylase-like metal-dependent hydrolase (beta-lactamase superfamily II)
MPDYVKGLHEVADGVWAYLQPDGGWGWSNAGLIAVNHESLLVDTLFDLPLTAEMLATMRRAVPAASRISTVVNTHANGDHWFGNSLLSGAEIVASAACASEMVDLPPSRLADLMRAAPSLGPAGRFLQRIFGPFEFENIDVALPTQTFDGTLDLLVGDRRVRLIEVGPAHTAGDVIVQVPDAGVVFTGDILFHGGHPIVWAGPVANWVAACDRIVELAPAVVVPGHGPLADVAAVRDMGGYFTYLSAEARTRFDAGLTPMEAAKDIDWSDYAGWGEAERVVVNIASLYRGFGADVAGDVASVFGQMASLASS